MNFKHLILSVVVLTAGGQILTNAEEHNKQHPLVYVAQAQVIEPEVVLIETRIDWTEERIKSEIDTVAEEYGVSAEVMKTVVRCESGYKTTALGDGIKSRGLVQIHSDFHDVTDEEAYDPKFSLRFLAEKLKEGKGDLWTCYRMHY